MRAIVCEGIAPACEGSAMVGEERYGPAPGGLVGDKGLNAKVLAEVTSGDGHSLLLASISSCSSSSSSPVSSPISFRCIIMDAESGHDGLGRL